MYCESLTVKVHNLIIGISWHMGIISLNVMVFQSEEILGNLLRFFFGNLSGLGESNFRQVELEWSILVKWC